MRLVLSYALDLNTDNSRSALVVDSNDKRCIVFRMHNFFLCHFFFCVSRNPNTSSRIVRIRALWNKSLLSNTTNCETFLRTQW